MNIDFGQVVTAAKVAEQERSATAALIAARRYTAEVAGIVVSGMPIDTGRDSQGLIAGAALQAILDPKYTCRWKTASGPVELDAEQLKAVAQAVRAHVQACFDREFALLDMLDRGTFKDYLLEKGWPNTGNAE